MLLTVLSDGKTKSLHLQADGTVKMYFKDNLTGSESGIDPGGNEVIAQAEGKGLMALKQSVYFFSLLERHGVPTHFQAADEADQSLVVSQAEWNGLEFIVRFKAFGSFVRRYGKFVNEGAELGTLVEITIKDDERGDPLINDETIAALNIMPLDKVQEVKALVAKAATVIRDDLRSKGLELIDIKFECGAVDDRIVIIDDISTDNMRVMLDGQSVGPEELLRRTVGE